MAEDNKGVVKKLNYGLLIVLLILISAAYYLPGEESVVAEHTEVDLSFLIVPVIALLAGAFLREVFNTYITGMAAKVVGNSIIILALAAAAYVFLSNPPVPPGYWVSANAALIIAAIFIANSLLGAFLSKRFVLQAVLRAVLVFLSGLFLYLFLLNFTWGNHLEMAIGDDILVLSPAGILLWSFILLSVMLVLALLTLSSNRYLTIAGLWFAGVPVLKYFIFLTFAFYFIDVRPFLEQIYYPEFQIYEWLGLALVFVALIISMVRGINSVVEKATYSGWIKHRQSLEINKGDFLVELANYVTEFLEQGDKKNLLTYIVAEALKKQFSFDQIHHVIKDFLDYADESEPPLMTGFGKNLLWKRNRNRRELVLNEMVNKFGQAGGEKDENRASA